MTTQPLSNDKEEEWWWKVASQDPAEVQIILMSDVGKPLYASYDSPNSGEPLRTQQELFESQVARFCGMIQALTNGWLLQTKSGHVKCIRVSSSLRVVLVTHGVLTGIAIGSTGQDEVMLRLHLDHVYAQAVFHMTGPALQASIQQNYVPLDWNRMLYNPNTPSALTHSSVPVCFPIPQQVRHEVSLWLHKKSSSSNNNTTITIYYVFLLYQNELVSCVQPDYTPHQLHMMDINLLLAMVKNKESSSSSSSQQWCCPVCFPHLDTNATLHCCVTTAHGFTLLLLTPSDTDNTLFTLGRQLLPDKSMNENSIRSSASSEDAEYELVPRPVVEEEPSPLERLRDVVTKHKDSSLLLSKTPLQHFFFRKRIVIPPTQRRRKRRGRKEGEEGCLYQSLTQSSLNNTREHHWKVYHDLCLRLRFGVQKPTTDVDYNGLEASMMEIPLYETVSYVLLDEHIYFAMNGKDFELYVMAAQSVTTAEETAAQAASLARQLLTAQNDLFLTTPLTFK